MPLGLSDKSGRIDPSRDKVFTGRGFHDYYYPSRAVRTHEYLYIRNFRPDLIPIGIELSEGVSKKSPTYQFYMANRHRSEVKPYFELAYGKRPAEELYDVRKDPYQLHNLALQENMKEIKEKLSADLLEFQQQTKDPLLEHGGHIDMSKINRLQ